MSAAAIAASLMMGGYAAAADLSAAPAYKAPAPVAAVYNWTGFYVGGNAGYGWGNQDPLVLFSNRFDRAGFDISGGMIGGTFGGQIQQGYVVLGLEGDLDWANIKGSSVVTPSILGAGLGATLNTSSSITALGTVRARLGIAMNNVLLYATGGAAFVKSTASASTVAGVPCGTAGVLPDCAGSSWRPGIAAGLGVEYGFTPNWSVKAEYLYTKVVGTGVSSDDLNIVRGGVNYRF
ncbi:porin family protein [Bradyrhizobium sp. Arg62]|uniref:outer membrane protein n=1 Tax=Bradyrhizobium brasilense TaxID=1419277 RepID=UPI001E38E455|nr:outer membrane beta-barrel protein [Bradyrhizobium brasilense]MCC8943596.1 porin family protein [Bradyrhizobium brasilense]